MFEVVPESENVSGESEQFLGNEEVVAEGDTEALRDINQHVSGDEGENKEIVENGNENQTNEGETVSNQNQTNENVPDQPGPQKSKLQLKKEKILAKYGIDPKKKLPRKPSVYGDFVDITDVKDESERKHVDPWVQEALESPPKKKTSPSKYRTGIKGMSRAEWLKSRGKKMEKIKFNSIKKAEAWLNEHNAEKEKEDNKEEEEIIPVEKLESDEEDEPVDTEKKVEDNQDDDDDGSAIYLDPEIDFVAFCRQEEEEMERKKTIVASQFKEINDSELDDLITQGAVFDIPVDRKRKFDEENSCDSFKKLKILETQGEKEDTNGVEEKNEDDEDIIESIPKKKAGKLNFDDDDEEEEEIQDEGEELEDEEEIEGEEAVEIDDEEAEENEEALLALQYKKEREKKLKRSDFYDDEASLSGDDIGSDGDEEDGSDLDAYEIMDGDFDEIGNQKDIVNDLAKQRILQELKADRKRLEKIKEKLNIYDEDDPEQAALIYRYQTRFMAEDVDVEVLERASDTEDHLEVVELPTEDSNTILSRKAFEKEVDDEWDKEVELGKKIMEKNKAAQMTKKRAGTNSIRNALGLSTFLNKIVTSNESKNDKL
uniref:U3 small nucleolar ribonucleoprotein protein MPP10 n=1 Tax=Strongyloides venezuelensis TaxID=75913 RepID=A0A0K0G1E2_STRVS